MKTDRICVASIETPNLKEMSEITVQNKIDYCSKRGYSFSILKQNEPYFGFDKILFIEGLLNTNKYDLIFWCDNDTIFTNFDKKIEDLIDDSHSFYIATDHSKTVNAGVFIIKNNEDCRRYLQLVKEKMYELAPQNTFKFGEEQTALIATYKDPSFSHVIKVLPQKLMNAYAYSGVRGHANGYPDGLGVNGDWQPGDLMLHMAGFGIDYYKECVEWLRKYSELVQK